MSVRHVPVAGNRRYILLNVAEDEKETVEGTIRSVVFHNDANGYTVLHVEVPSEFELAKNPEITIVGKTQACWEGEDVKAVGQWITDKSTLR